MDIVHTDHYIISLIFICIFWASDEWFSWGFTNFNFKFHISTPPRQGTTPNSFWELAGRSSGGSTDVRHRMCVGENLPVHLPVNFQHLKTTQITALMNLKCEVNMEHVFNSTLLTEDKSCWITAISFSKHQVTHALFSGEEVSYIKQWIS